MQNTQTYTNTFSIKQVRSLVIFTMLSGLLMGFTSGYFFAKNLEQEKITQLTNEKNAIIAGHSSNAIEIDDELHKPPLKNKPVSNSDSITKPKKLNFGIVIGDEKYW
jgi:hypothetical protein